MNYARALAALGIDDDDGLTRTQLRRIYLRKLREHPPETDPDGFSLLREAFELVRDYVADDPEAHKPAPAITFMDASTQVPPKADVFVPPGGAPIAPPIGAGVPPLAIGAPPNTRSSDVPSGAPPVGGAETTERPRPRLPPLAPLEDEPPLKLSALLARLLELLASGLVAAARALEHDWHTKTQGGDLREATGLLAARWLLVRELLGVVADIPIAVTKILAKALAEGDLASARLSLIVYGREQPIEAELAADVIAKRAPNIFKPIENTLYVPKPKPVPPLQPGGVFGYGLDFMRAMADKNKRR